MKTPLLLLVLLSGAFCLRLSAQDDSPATYDARYAGLRAILHRGERTTAAERQAKYASAAADFKRLWDEQNRVDVGYSMSICYARAAMPAEAQTAAGATLALANSLPASSDEIDRQKEALQKILAWAAAEMQPGTADSGPSVIATGLVVAAREPTPPPPAGHRAFAEAAPGP